MYYVLNNDNLSIYSDDIKILEDTKSIMPQLYGKETLETDIIDSKTLEAHPNKVIVADVEIEIDVPDCDEEGNPIIIEYTDTEVIVDYDDEGNPIGTHNVEVIKHKQQTHKETIEAKRLILNPNYEQEEEEKERQRINQLSLTKREVFLALYRDKGLVPDIIRQGLQGNPEALIEFDYAERYFRGNPLIDIIGNSLGYSSDDMDYLFEYKEFPGKEGEE